MSEPKRDPETKVDQDLGNKRSPATVTPQEPAFGEGEKSVADRDTEASGTDVERIPDPAAQKKKDIELPPVNVGDAVHFWVNDPTSRTGQRALGAVVSFIDEENGRVNLCAFAVTGAAFGQVGIEFSEEPRVGRWSRISKKTTADGLKS